MKNPPYTRTVLWLAISIIGSNILLNVSAFSSPGHSEEKCLVPARFRRFRVYDALPGSHPDFGLHTGVVVKGAVENHLVDGFPFLSNEHLGKGPFTTRENFDTWFGSSFDISIYTRIYDRYLDISKKGKILISSRTFSPSFYDPILDEISPEGNPYYNLFFTTIIVLDFKYTKDIMSDAVFEFSGTDDLWVFVNNVLVIDLGGNHPIESGSLIFSDIVAKSGIELGQMYNILIFHTQRSRAKYSASFSTNIPLVCFVPELCGENNYYDVLERKCAPCKKCEPGTQLIPGTKCNGIGQGDTVECEPISPLTDGICGVCHSTGQSCLSQGDRDEKKDTLLYAPTNCTEGISSRDFWSDEVVKSFFEPPECGETPYIIKYRQRIMYLSNCEERDKWFSYATERCEARIDGVIKNCERSVGTCGRCVPGADENTGSWEMAERIVVLPVNCGEYAINKIKNEFLFTSANCYDPDILKQYPESNDANKCDEEERGDYKGCTVLFGFCATCTTIPEDGDEKPSHEWHETLVEHHNAEEVPCGGKFYDEYTRKFNYTAYDCNYLAQTPPEISDRSCYSRVDYEEHLCETATNGLNANLKTIIAASLGTAIALLSAVLVVTGIFHRLREKPTNNNKTRSYTSVAWRNNENPIYNSPTLTSTSCIYEQPTPP